MLIYAPSYTHILTHALTHTHTHALTHTHLYTCPHTRPHTHTHTYPLPGLSRCLCISATPPGSLGAASAAYTSGRDPGILTRPWEVGAPLPTEEVRTPRPGPAGRPLPLAPHNLMVKKHKDRCDSPAGRGCRPTDEFGALRPINSFVTGLSRQACLMPASQRGSWKEAGPIQLPRDLEGRMRRGLSSQIRTRSVPPAQCEPDATQRHFLDGPWPLPRSVPTRSKSANGPLFFLLHGPQSRISNSRTRGAGASPSSPWNRTRLPRPALGPLIPSLGESHASSPAPTALPHVHCPCSPRTPPSTQALTAGDRLSVLHSTSHQGQLEPELKPAPQLRLRWILKALRQAGD